MRRACPTKYLRCQAKSRAIVFVDPPTKPRVRVVECPPPPRPAHADYGRRTMDGIGEVGYRVRGSWVVINQFSDAWQTGFVSMRGLPGEFVGTVDDARAYCKRLHDLLVETYATLDVPVPAWRSWNSFVDRWPFLSGGTRRVHVLKPL